MSLSDKEMYVECGADLTDNYLFGPDEIVFKKGDVKKFIEDLKRTIPIESNRLTGQMVHCIIDKAAGDMSNGN